jgi:hypothetical protein
MTPFIMVFILIEGVTPLEVAKNCKLEVLILTLGVTPLRAFKNHSR